MKTINITFTDEEHESLSDQKGNMSWHNFIMLLANQEIKIEQITDKTKGTLPNIQKRKLNNGNRST